MSARKSISNSFTVNTVEDGQSAPYYFQEWFAWSNVESTTNATTSPFGNDTEPNPAWSTSIPENTGGLAYLWSKSIRYVLNESTRQYATETAQYYRKTGTNGTSIKTKGSVSYVATSSSALPTTRVSIGELAIVQGNNTLLKYQQVYVDTYAWAPTGQSAVSDGDAYICAKDSTVDLNGSGTAINVKNHLIQYSAEASKWIDLGQFKGENGTTYYTHIAWATAVTLSDTQLPIPTGQTNRPNAIEANIEGFAITPTTGVNYAWMGYLIDIVSSDSQVKQNYTWEKNKGDKGDGGVSYGFTFTKSSARADEEGIITAELAGYAYKYVGGVRTALTSTTIRYGYILTDSDTYTTETTDSYGFFDAGYWFDGDDISGSYVKNSPSIFAAIEIDGVVVHAEMITISLKGETGARGKVGRFFYFGGTFDSSDSDQTHTFVVNDAQAPYFEHAETVTTQSGTTTIKRYHVFNYETNGSYTMAQMWAISSNWNNKPWEAMTNDFKYIITEAIFGSFAHFDSAIISGDWMLSQHGTKNGVASTSYTDFDPAHPNDNTGSNFIPNYCVDLLTGATYQNIAVVRGTVYAESGYFNGSLRTVFHNIANDSGWVYYSPSDIIPSGMGFGWNYVVGDYDNMCMLARKESPSSGVMSNNLHIRLPNTLSMIGRRIILYEMNQPPFSDGFSAFEIRQLNNAAFVGVSAGGHDLIDFQAVYGVIICGGVVEFLAVPHPTNTAICTWAITSIDGCIWDYTTTQ